MSISGRFVALAAAMWVIVLILPVDAPWGLVVVNVVLLALAVVDLFLAGNPRTINVQRVVPPTVSLHTESTIEWELRSEQRRRVHVRFADELKPSLGARSRTGDVWIPAQGRVFASTTFEPSRRGRFIIEELSVRVYGPLGLLARQKRRKTMSILRVYPYFASRKEAEMRVERARVLELGQRSVRVRGGGSDFDQLREYTIDDDYRRIDWAATARVGKPIVKTFRAEQNQNVVLLLDAGRVMAGRVADVPRLEHAMDAAMALTTVASRLGDRVGMIAFDTRVRAEVAARSGSAQLARVTEAMYDIEAQLQESDYRQAFVRTMSKFRRRSMVVVLTELAEQAVTETLIPALSLVSKNHLVVVASVRDPDVLAWSTAVPTEADKAYRKASAISALNGRRRIIAALKSRGATVVDSEPGRLAADLADTYLSLKNSGRL